ncbi:MAG: hypothetical protein ACFFCS_15270 [Candidatus Hodarchaeota archaeon]
MARFHELVKYYDDLHQEHEYKPHTVSTKVFYTNFLERFDEAFGDVQDQKIKEIIQKVRNKAQILSEFNERKKLHDLAERTVDRLNELGMELYALPEINFLLESTKEIEVSMLMACCPEFVQEESLKDTALRCKGTVKKIKVGIGQDIQPAVKMYYEKYCRDCAKRERLKQLGINLLEETNGYF